MNLISRQYKSLLIRDHEQSPDWGSTGKRYADFIEKLCKQYSTFDVLDYGCGKSTLAESIGFPVAEYDPGIVGKDTPPSPADIVVSTDVLEHVEPECVDSVLEHIKSLTKVCGFHAISCTKAAHILPDGRNAHISAHGASWWVDKLEAHGFGVFEHRLPCNAPRYETITLTVQVFPNG